MANAKVILVESERPPTPLFAEALQRKGYAVTVEHNVQAALKKIQSHSTDVIILDVSSLKTSGMRMLRALRAELNGTPILVVADKKNKPDENAGQSLTLVKPFTPRKLLNGVVRLLPADDSNYLQVGPIKLNLAQRRIACGGREERVTPKQIRLLEVFMRHPGEILSRKTLIKQVWDTDYTGDTRTLDVHISWLRGVIEPNPAKPRYIRTIRGQGYRLDVP
ncbi:MAG: response regulator transcription factor [Chloroflexi bacterium]|nr:response regulator transcription factor [Chloroflexota bacterium]MBI3761386.1 response regulator transcription factor [Chloroflexota bacterium]